MGASPAEILLYLPIHFKALFITNLLWIAVSTSTSRYLISTIRKLKGASSILRRFGSQLSYYSDKRKKFNRKRDGNHNLRGNCFIHFFLLVSELKTNVKLKWKNITNIAVHLCTYQGISNVIIFRS